MQHARLVALQDVPGLVPDHAGELGLALGEHDEGAVHADVSAGEGEGIDGIVLHNEVVDVARGAVGRGQEARPERGDVVGDLGIVEVGGIDADVPHDAVADRAFLRIGEGRCRRVAEIGERLGEPRRPGKTEQQRRYEGAGFHVKGSGGELATMGL